MSKGNKKPAAAPVELVQVFRMSEALGLTDAEEVFAHELAGRLTTTPVQQSRRARNAPRDMCGILVRAHPTDGRRRQGQRPQEDQDPEAKTEGLNLPQRGRHDGYDHGGLVGRISSYSLLSSESPNFAARISRSSSISPFVNVFRSLVTNCPFLR